MSLINKKLRSEQPLWWLNLTPRGLNLTSRKLDLTKMDLFYPRLNRTLENSKNSSLLSLWMFNLTLCGSDVKFSKVLAQNGFKPIS